MIIAGFPAGAVTIASARLRYHAIVRGLAEHGVTTVEGYSPDAQLVYVQKRLTPEVLAMAQQAQARGQRVWYDVDDTGDVLNTIAPSALLGRMLALADLVTTGTPWQRAALIASYGERVIHLFPNLADYDPVKPDTRPQREADPLLRILWFGYASNLRLLRHYLTVLATLPSAEILVLTNTGGRPFRNAPAAARFAPWALETFVQELTASHLSCLMHDGTADDRAKTNTRMVTSIAWGVPAVVSRTPEYERTARECGVEDAIFDGPEQLIEVVERLRSADARTRYLARAQRVIWAQYAPQVVVDSVLTILRTALPGLG